MPRNCEVAARFHAFVMALAAGTTPQILLVDDDVQREWLPEGRCDEILDAAEINWAGRILR